MSLGHDFADPPPPTTYLSVDEELLLLRHYCLQASKVVRDGFQLPESLESTAISYLKRFYLKNSVMEWHPKIVMYAWTAGGADTAGPPACILLLRRPTIQSRCRTFKSDSPSSMLKKFWTMNSSLHSLYPSSSGSEGQRRHSVGGP